MDEMVPVYLAMTVTVIFLRYEVKDSEKYGILRRRFFMPAKLRFYAS